MQHSPPSDANSWSYSHEIPHIYANQRIITVFTKVRYMSLSFNKSSPLHPLMSIFTFSSHILAGLQSGLSPSGFPIKILYTFLVYPIHCTCLSKGTVNEEHERHHVTLMTQPNLTLMTQPTVSQFVPSQNIMMVIKPWKICAGREAHTHGKEEKWKEGFGWENLKERDHLEDPHVTERIIL